MGWALRPVARGVASLVLVLLCPGVTAQEDGHWIFRHFVERMDCRVDEPEVEYWDGVYSLLFQPAATETPLERIASLGTALADILLPFNTADPVMALSCPLGTSAALLELGVLCAELFQERCIQRALRLMHLSKLFMLFNFNDFGAWFAATRWRTDTNRLHTLTQELLRLSRADGLDVAAHVKEPLDFREPALRIGVVTYCNYNDTRTRLTVLSRSNKRAYAERHSYTLFHFEEPFVAQAHPWMNKLLAIQETLPDFDWIFWVDCDLFFMSPGRTVDALIRSALALNPDAALLLAEDGMMLNSGSFLLRNSDWGRRFLANTMDLLSAPTPYSFQHMPWHEQAPLMYLALVPSVLSGLADMGAQGSLQGGGVELSSGYDPHVVLLQQRSMNSYPPELVAKTGHALAHQAWEEGDLVISFNGCSSILGGDFCEAMYGRYHSRSMDKFSLGA